MTNELIQLVGADYYEDSRGVATIALNGVILMSESDSNLLDAKLTNVDGTSKYQLFIKDTLRTVDVSSGEIYGLIQSRDEAVVSFMDKLDQIAGALIANVNQVNKAGYDLNGDAGINFFDGTGASDIAVNDFVALDGSLIAASSTKTNVEGNGENALAISALRELGVFDSGSTSINKYFQNLISDLGVNSLASQNYLQTNEDIIGQLNNQIAAVSGVSIDEEMTDMVKFQNSYQAAAKYLSIIQEILDTLIQMV